MTRNPRGRWWRSRPGPKVSDPPPPEPEIDNYNTPLKDWLIFMPTALPRPRAERGENQEPKYLPTPEQITAECRRIQAGWSDWERAARITGDGPEKWEVRVIDTSEVVK